MFIKYKFYICGNKTHNMKKKLSEIQAEMDKLVYKPLYYLSTEWIKLKAQKDVLNEILATED